MKALDSIIPLSLFGEAQTPSNVSWNQLRNIYEELTCEVLEAIASLFNFKLLPDSDKWLLPCKTWTSEFKHFEEGDTSGLQLPDKVSDLDVCQPEMGSQVDDISSKPVESTGGIEEDVCKQVKFGNKQKATTFYFNYLYDQWN